MLQIASSDLVTVAFGRAVLDGGDAAVNELLVGKEGFENDLSVLVVVAVQVLSLDFFFADDFDPVEHSELGHVEEAL